MPMTRYTHTGPVLAHAPDNVRCRQWLHGLTTQPEGLMHIGRSMPLAVQLPWRFRRQRASRMTCSIPKGNLEDPGLHKGCLGQNSIIIAICINGQGDAINEASDEVHGALVQVGGHVVAMHALAGSDVAVKGNCGAKVGCTILDLVLVAVVVLLQAASSGDLRGVVLLDAAHGWEGAHVASSIK